MVNAPIVIPIISRNSPNNANNPMLGHSLEAEIKDPSSDHVEIPIRAIGQGFREPVLKIRRFVVDTLVCAEHVDDPVTLVLSPGYAYDLLRAPVARDLDRAGSHRPGGCVDEQSGFGTDLEDVDYALVCC